MNQFLEVSRSNPGKTRIAEGEIAPLEAGQVRVSVDAFALTANNVTYAVAGDMLKYWDFFPTGDAAWGRVPAWGFGDVVESRADGVEVGERFYGYFPMGSHLVMEPVKVDTYGFIDGAAHRAHLNSVYNHYARCSVDPAYNKDFEAQIMLFRPLFSTSFLIDDLLADNDFFGAEQVVISSASAKTSLGTASVMKQLGGRPSVIGLTSDGNKAFVETLGLYDQVLSYSEVGQLDKDVATAFVDIAGSARVRASVHEHFANKLTYSCAVGASHWSEFAPSGPLPGPEPQMFFAPAQANKRSSDWGTAELQARIGKAFVGFVSLTADWLDVKTLESADAVTDAWQALVAGQVDPRQGLIASLED